MVSTSNLDVLENKLQEKVLSGLNKLKEIEEYESKKRRTQENENLKVWRCLESDIKEGLPEILRGGMIPLTELFRQKSMKPPESKVWVVEVRLNGLAPIRTTVTSNSDGKWGILNGEPLFTLPTAFENVSAEEEGEEVIWNFRPNYSMETNDLDIAMAWAFQEKCRFDILKRELQERVKARIERIGEPKYVPVEVSPVDEGLLKFLEDKIVQIVEKL